MPSPALIDRATHHPNRIALRDTTGRDCTYQQLLDASASAARRLLDGADDLAEARVALLVPPSFAYVAIQWAIWRAGGIAVPLAISHPPAEWAHVLDDARPTTLVVDPAWVDRIGNLAADRGTRVLISTDLLALGPTEGRPTEEPHLAPTRRAMMVYTSGTTGKPKGVVTTHGNLTAQITTLIDAWGWTADDRILCPLPLHHVHGIVNIVCCALWAGARCDLLPRFDADAVWQRFLDHDLTLFMAVPTIYRRLIAAWDAASPERQAAMTASCHRLRLMVSGSAALPVATLERWRAISGHTLLERYGMTELGMVLSNPLHGERRPGTVGTPLPGVEVRLVDTDGDVVADGTPGEIEVRGPNVFLEYWNRPDETDRAFHDGWFRTGDTATLHDGAYRILGRNSVDIIKTAGYKISALEIEEVLRAHPTIEECAVVGIEDEEWGQRVCVAVETASDQPCELETVRAWAAEHLAPYKLPRELLTVSALPRNAMGKVVKPEVAALFHR